MRKVKTSEEHQRKEQVHEIGSGYSSTTDIQTGEYYKQFEEFGGYSEIEINITIPTSYWNGLRTLCKKIDMPVREWINHALLNQINEVAKTKGSLCSPVNDKFLSEYKIGLLSPDTQKQLVERCRVMRLNDLRLNDS